MNNDFVFFNICHTGGDAFRFTRIKTRLLPCKPVESAIKPTSPRSPSYCGCVICTLLDDLETIFWYLSCVARAWIVIAFEMRSTDPTLSYILFYFKDRYFTKFVYGKKQTEQTTVYPSYSRAIIQDENLRLNVPTPAVSINNRRLTAFPSPERTRPRYTFF